MAPPFFSLLAHNLSPHIAVSGGIRLHNVFEVCRVALRALACACVAASGIRMSKLLRSLKSAAAIAPCLGSHAKPHCLSLAASLPLPSFTFDCARPCLRMLAGCKWQGGCLQSCRERQVMLVLMSWMILAWRLFVHHVHEVDHGDRSQRSKVRGHRHGPVGRLLPFVGLVVHALTRPPTYRVKSMKSRLQMFMIHNNMVGAAWHKFMHAQCRWFEKTSRSEKSNSRGCRNGGHAGGGR